MKPTSILYAIVLLLAGCCGSDSFDYESDLKIDREDPDNKTSVIEHEDGTITKKFRVHPMMIDMLAFQSGDRSAVPDPFQEPAGDELASGARWPVRKAFEKAEVPFPDGTDIKYDRDSGMLTVRHDSEWVDFVEIVLESLKPQQTMLNLRVEIYEVPKALALRLEQSADEHSDHQPEWKALQKIVRAGDAEFVTSCNVRARSGQRAKYVDGEEQLLFAGFEWDKSVDPPVPKPVLEARTVGTIIEFDPVIGADNELVDLNLSLEHHTAPPTMAPLEVPVPGNQLPVAIEAPVFHVKTLTTQVTMMNGGKRLMCSWNPTGLPGPKRRDVMRIVFLGVNVQRTYPGYD